MSYKTCKWCGRKFDERNAVYSGLGGIFGNDFGGGVYCSEKCKAEAEAKAKGVTSNSSYDDDDHSTGLLGIIWKVVKWVIIITIIWFVYDNYIKGDTSKTESPTSHLQSSSKSDVVSSGTSSQTSTEIINDSKIKQIASLWSACHNNRDLYQLYLLYANNVRYYQSDYSRDQIHESKEKLMNKYPDFKQEISNLSVKKEDSYYKVSFDKKVWTDSQTAPKTYPSYLHVKMIDGSLKIIAESDLVTDKNLSKKK